MQFLPRDVGLLAVEDVRKRLLEQIRAVETLRLAMRTGTSVMDWVAPPMYTSFCAHYPAVNSTIYFAKQRSQV